MEMVKSGAKTLEEEISRNLLVKRFNEKYIPRVAKDKLTMEFQNLKQDQFIVSQYEVKFTQLMRYTGRLVSEEKDRTKRFGGGFEA